MGREYLKDFIQDNHYKIRCTLQLLANMERDLNETMPDLLPELGEVANRNRLDKAKSESERLKLKY